MMTAAIAGPIELLPSADAAKSKGTPLLATGSNKVCGDQLCSEVGGRTEMPSAAVEEEEEAMEEAAPTMEPKMEEKMMPHAMWQSATGTLQSMQDPGIGHETHQLAIILPPSDKVYKGILSYDASEPIQLVALHGPLADGEDMGQAIWTPDGETKFALTFVDPETNMGMWAFAGNALAVHTMNEEQFTISYSVVAGQ